MSGLMLRFLLHWHMETVWAYLVWAEIYKSIHGIHPMWCEMVLPSRATRETRKTIHGVMLTLDRIVLGMSGAREEDYVQYSIVNHCLF